MSSHSCSKLSYGVLFDLDGVLVNTEPLKNKAHVQSAAAFGGNLSPEFYLEVMGRSQKVVAETAIRLARISTSVSDYTEVFENLYARALDAGIQCNEGVCDFLDQLRIKGYRLALVSSSPSHVVKRILTLSDLSERLDVVVAADDVVAPKPAPDAYLFALRALGLESPQSVAFEDTESGMIAAMSAGLRVVSVKHEMNRRQDFARAAAHITGLEDWRSVIQLVATLLSNQAKSS